MRKAEVSNELSVVERRSLKDLEKVIESGVKSLLATGAALKEIRDSKLYREGYKTFESYLKAKWGFDRSYAHRLIDASGVKKDLLPMGNKVPRTSEINSERQLRELKNLPDGQLEEVVAKAIEIAGDSSLTAKVLKEAKNHVLELDELEWLGVPDEPEEPIFEDVEPEPEPEEVGPLQCVPWFKDQLRLVNELKRNLDQVKESPGNELFFSRQRTILREVDHVKGGLLAAMPHAICPRCNGQCCAQCGNMGWVNKQRYDELEGK